MQDKATKPRRTRMKGAPGVYRSSSGSYEIAYTDSDGKLRFKTIGSNFEEAKAERAAIETRKNQGERVVSTKITLAEVADEFFVSFEGYVKAGERAQRTLDLYRQRWRTHIEPRLGRKRVQSISAVEISSLLRDLRESELSSWTAHGVLTALGSILGHAKTRNYINAVPTVNLDKKERPKQQNAKEVRVLTSEEIDRIIGSVTKRWKPVIEVAALTGARASEVLGLMWGDWNVKDGTLTFQRQLGHDGTRVPLKTKNSYRTIKVGEDLRRVLLAVKIAARDKSDGAFMFASATGAAPTYRNLARTFQQAVKDAKVPFDKETERASFHCLRHGAVSALIRSGVDAGRIAHYVGDRVETILKVYAHEFELANEENLSDALAGVYGRTVESPV